MKPTDILVREHRLIEQVLDSLEEMTRRADAEGRLNRQAADDALEFLRGFGGRWHQQKEEACLLPRMEAKGMSHDDGLVAAVLRDHEQAAALYRAIESVIEPAADGDLPALHEFARYVHAYVGLRREHIHREDDRLFAVANDTLDDEDQHRLLEAFEEVESEEADNGNWESHLRAAQELADHIKASLETAGDAAYQPSYAGTS